MADCPPGWRIERHAILASTQAACIAAAEAGAADGLAILADRQTAGQGRQGRVWHDDAGNLSISLLVRPGGRLADLPCWSLLAGIALHDALAPLAGGRTLQLKWPNDILIGGAKLAGLLLNGAGRADGGCDWLVIGAGANLAWCPHLPDRSTTSLAPDPPAPMVAACALMAAVTRWRAALAEGGPAAIHAAWLARAHPLGTPLHIHTPTGPSRGDFAGLAPDGALLLRTPAGTRRCHTDDVLLDHA